MYLLIGLAEASELQPYFALGNGFIRLAHAEVGLSINPGLAVELRGAWVLFSPVVGVALEGTVWAQAGSRQGHAVTVTMEGMLNPTLRPLRWESGGETLGGYIGVLGGWRWQSQRGFLVRAQGGVLLYEDGGFAVGPDFSMGVGWVFKVP
jgi:hypothetical protein